MQIQFNVGSAKVWFAYYGQDPKNNFQQAHADATGNIVANTPSAKPTDAITHPVPSGPINLPMLSAARLYLSIGAPLLFPVDPTGSPNPPKPADATDPNYKTPWDFFELTYIPQGSDELFNINLSTVQSANLPLTFHVAGTEPSTKKPVDYTRGWLPGGYGKFVSYLGGNADFRQLVLPGTQRVLAPGTAITALEEKVIAQPLIASDYLKAYIDKVWTKFAGVDLTFIGDPPPNSSTFVTWTGRVKNGQFTFTTNYPNLEPIVLEFPIDLRSYSRTISYSAHPVAEHLIHCNRTTRCRLFGTLCAAFNRSMMLTTTTLANSSNCDWCKAKDQFYQDPTTNHYSESDPRECDRRACLRVSE